MTEPILVSTMPALAAVLREAREARGLSQDAVARRLFVHNTAVSNWECCRVRPVSGLLIAWARVVGMPLWMVPESRDLAAGGLAAQLLEWADDEACRPGRSCCSRAIETWLREAAQLAQDRGAV